MFETTCSPEKKTKARNNIGKEWRKEMIQHYKFLMLNGVSHLPDFACLVSTSTALTAIKVYV